MPTRPASDLTGAGGTQTFVFALCIYSPKESSKQLIDAGCGVTVGILMVLCIQPK